MANDTPTREGQRAAVALLARLWLEGPGLDDRDEIERVSLVCEGSEHVQLRTMLSWIDAMDGRPVGTIREIERRELAAIAASTRLRHALNAGDLQEVDRWIQILARDPIAAFSPVARGMIDLAIIDAGLFARNPAAIEATAFELASEGQPIAIRIQAARRCISVALNRADFPAATEHAREARDLARSSKRPLEERIAQGMLGICTTLAGNKAKPSGDLLADLSVAMFEPPMRALNRLTELMARAGEAGDPLAYMLSALVGARRYIELDHRVDAWLTITSALVSLRQHDPLYAGPLEEEREKWLEAWGQEEYDRVTKAGVALAKKQLPQS